MKIFYQRSYSIGPYLTEKIGFEIEVIDPASPTAQETIDNAMSSVSVLKQLCDKAHEELNPHLQNQSSETITQQPVQRDEPLERTREEQIAAHLITINECKTLKNLQLFYQMVQRENDPTLIAAYEEKKKELIKPEIDDIMKRTEALTKK